MGLLDRFRKKPPATIHEMPAHHHTQTMYHLATGLRKGMWVMVRSSSEATGAEEWRIGILLTFHTDYTAEVHFVDSRGETYLQLPHVALADMRQAVYEEIPESRKAHMSREDFAKWGY